MQKEISSSTIDGPLVKMLLARRGKRALEAAILMGISEAHFSRALRGRVILGNREIAILARLLETQAHLILTPEAIS